MNAPEDEVEEPDFKLQSEQPKHNGLMCFLNDTRECGSDCMAYLPQPIEAQALSPQQGNCILIVSLERLGRYSGGVSASLNKMNQRAVDQARGHRPPPDPQGKA